MKFRHELKYSINMADYLVIRERLKHIAEPDSHADEDGTYKIRSLYFETPTDKNLNEKLYGIPEREKFRFRFYGNDTSFIRLEKKSKIANATNKISCPISKEEVERILSGDYEWMLNSKHALIAELYAKMQYLQLRPKTIVVYDRECWIYDAGNVRVTFDLNISTGITSTDFLNPDVPLVKALGIPTIIMEVKYDEFIPSFIADILNAHSGRVQAYSKYAQCRKYN